MQAVPQQQLQGVPPGRQREDSLCLPAAVVAYLLRGRQRPVQVRKAFQVDQQVMVPGILVLGSRRCDSHPPQPEYCGKGLSHDFSVPGGDEIDGSPFGGGAAGQLDGGRLGALRRGDAGPEQESERQYAAHGKDVRVTGKKQDSTGFTAYALLRALHRLLFFVHLLCRLRCQYLPAARLLCRLRCQYLPAAHLLCRLRCQYLPAAHLLCCLRCVSACRAPAVLPALPLPVSRPAAFLSAPAVVRR